MKHLFRKFVNEQGLAFTGMPNQATLVELSINFNRWANHPYTKEEPVQRGPNRQGTKAWQVGKYIKNLLAL